MNINVMNAHYLVSDMGGCANGKAQAQHHAGCLGNKTDQVKGGGRLFRRTVGTQAMVNFIDRRRGAANLHQIHR